MALVAVDHPIAGALEAEATDAERVLTRIARLRVNIELLLLLGESEGRLALVAAGARNAREDTPKKLNRDGARRRVLFGLGALLASARSGRAWRATQRKGTAYDTDGNRTACDTHGKSTACDTWGKMRVRFLCFCLVIRRQRETESSWRQSSAAGHSGRSSSRRASRTNSSMSARPSLSSPGRSMLRVPSAARNWWPRSITYRKRYGMCDKERMATSGGK